MCYQKLVKVNEPSTTFYYLFAISAPFCVSEPEIGLVLCELRDSSAASMFSDKLSFPFPT